MSSNKSGNPSFQPAAQHPFEDLRAVISNQKPIYNVLESTLPDGRASALGERTVPRITLSPRCEQGICI